MAGHGGYRKPANPAPVSGPGAHSARTDGKQPIMDLPDAEYGQGQAFRELQAGANMPGPPAAPQGAVQSGSVGAPDPMSQVVGLHEPSTMPGTPVTDGAAAGAGAGPEALGLIDNPNQADAQYMKQYLPAFIRMANDGNTPPGFKQWVRNIISNL
jgi:hypothetical protein